MKTLITTPGNLFDLLNPNARANADVWKGCSQASSHATTSSNHPSVREPDLRKALSTWSCITSEETIYHAAGENIRDYVLERAPV